MFLSIFKSSIVIHEMFMIGKFELNPSNSCEELTPTHSQTTFVPVTTAVEG